mgnify:CR=1 FL=1
MPNMSYCRFRNTVEDLRDCYRNMDLDEERADPEEVRARQRLIELCQVIAADYADDKQRG